MKILQIANKAIYPPDGGSLAILSMAKGYIKNGHQVQILNMTTHKHFNDLKIIEDEFVDSLKISGVKINTRISFYHLLVNLLFSKKPYIAKRFISKNFELQIHRLLKNNSFNFIQLEGLYTLQYINFIKENIDTPIIYRPHNIEYLIWERNYKETESLVKKIYFKSVFKRLKRLEISLLNSYDFIIPITENDALVYKTLGNNKPVQVTPFGVDVNSTKIKPIESSFSPNLNINYIGALDWIPNQEGLLWFIEKCFPLILKSLPTIQLNIAGRNAPQWLVKKLNVNNIKFYGEVQDASEFIKKSGPIIVPLFSGSGMRVKIIESMFLKKAVVATKVAVEGISCETNENILIADDVKSFSDSVVSLINNVDLQVEIGGNAYTFVKTNYV